MVLSTEKIITRITYPDIIDIMVRILNAIQTTFIFLSIFVLSMNEINYRKILGETLSKKKIDYNLKV